MNEQLYLTNNFIDYTDNVYEAIMVVAKRARKIAADQKLEIERMLSTLEPVEEDEEGENHERMLELDMEKSMVIAFREFAKGDLDHDYKDKT